MDKANLTIAPGRRLGRKTNAETGEINLLITQACERTLLMPTSEIVRELRPLVLAAAGNALTQQAVLDAHRKLLAKPPAERRVNAPAQPSLSANVGRQPLARGADLR